MTPRSLTRRSLLTGTAALAGAAAVPAVPAAAHADRGERERRRAGRRVRPGIEMLIASGYAALRGAKVGIITNPTGILPDLRHEVDVMHAAAGAVNLVAVFGPEHGFRGTAQAGGSEGFYVDPRTGLPVYDTYGLSGQKLDDVFARSGVDTVVFDIQDVGARFYTYIWTMYDCLESAARLGLRFVVLDRPNPVGGVAPRGPVLHPGYATFVGRKPIAQQHAMTVGELALLFAHEFVPAATGHQVEVEVVRMAGWSRAELFAAAGLPWGLPSPNMPTANTALVYPGTCMFEGTVLSEGRGTTRPFELIGTPWVDPARWITALDAERLDGVGFREAWFTPTFSKFSGTVCGGVQLHLTDPARFDAIRTATAMIVTARHVFPDAFAWRSDLWIDKLTGSDRFRRQVDAGDSTDAVVAGWASELAAFDAVRRRYLLYPPTRSRGED